MVALASSNDYTRGRAVAFLPVALTAAGYTENRTLSVMTLVWEPDDIGLAAGVTGAMCTATSAVATSMYSSILTTEAAKYMPHYVPEAAIAAGLPSSRTLALFQGITNGTFSTIPGITNAINTTIGHAVKHSYSLAFQSVFLCTLSFGVIILIATVMAPNVEDYLTDEVARKLHGLKTRVLTINWKLSEHYKTIFYLDITALPVFFHVASRLYELEGGQLLEFENAPAFNDRS